MSAASAACKKAEAVFFPLLCSSKNSNIRKTSYVRYWLASQTNSDINL